MRIEPWLPPKLGRPRRLDLQVALPLARKVHGDTQHQLGVRLRVSPWTVGRWERGERYPYQRLEKELVRYFNSANKILAGEKLFVKPAENKQASQR